MSLFDTLKQAAGGVLGGQQGGMPAGGHGAVVDMVQGLIQQQGGLSGLLSKFEQNGLGAQVASWVGTGPNQPINAQHVMDALGSTQVGQMAQKLGINPQQMAGHLSTLLPQLVNHLTPNGQMPAGGAVGEALNLFKNKLASQ